MSVVTLRLLQLPAGLETVRAMAPRTDGLDGLPAKFVNLGFQPHDGIGATVDIDLAATGIRVGQIPPEVEVCLRVKRTGPAPYRCHGDLAAAALGVPVLVPIEAAEVAIAQGYAVAA